LADAYGARFKVVWQMHIIHWVERKRSALPAGHGPKNYLKRCLICVPICPAKRSVRILNSNPFPSSILILLIYFTAGSAT
jgi:hypothetical protein